MKTKPIFKRATGLGRTVGDNLDWKFQYEKELKDEKEKKMKRELQSKLMHDAWKNYDREIYMSEYTPINKEHYRRLRTCAIVSLGINLFLLLVMVLR